MPRARRADPPPLASPLACRLALWAPSKGSRTAMGVPGQAARRSLSTVIIAAVMLVVPSFVPCSAKVAQGLGRAAVVPVS